MSWGCRGMEVQKLASWREIELFEPGDTASWTPIDHEFLDQLVEEAKVWRQQSLLLRPTRSSSGEVTIRVPLFL